MLEDVAQVSSLVTWNVMAKDMYYHSESSSRAKRYKLDQQQLYRIADRCSEIQWADP